MGNARITKEGKLILRTYFSKTLRGWEEEFDCYLEKKQTRRRLKKLIKKYDVLNKEIILGTINNLIQETHSEFLITEKVNEMHKDFHYQYIVDRLYELNNEFINSLEKECFLSSFAIIRHIIDLFVRVLLVNVNRNYLGNFGGNPKKKFPFKMHERLKEIEDSSYPLNLEFEKDKTHKDYFKMLQRHWKKYSNFNHPTPESFSQNLRVSNPKTGELLPYWENQKLILKEKSILVYFKKKTLFSPPQIQEIISNFYNYLLITHYQARIFQHLYFKDKYSK